MPQRNNGNDKKTDLKNMAIKQIIINLLLGVAAMFCFTQCDTLSAEEHKAQAISYAESGEHQKAAQAYLKAAEKGDAESQFVVGYLYMMGDKISKNPLKKNIKKSMLYLGDALMNKVYMAAYFLGQIYELEDDYVSLPAAVKCYESAYSKGCLSAGIALATIYMLNGEFQEYEYGVQLNQEIRQKIFDIGLDPNDRDLILDYDMSQLQGQLKI